MNPCVICKEQFEGYGCNAYPIIPGECCPRCDDLIILPVRILLAKGTDVAHIFRDAIEMRKAKQLLRKKHEAKSPTT
jgi:hypothetical protein